MKHRNTLLGASVLALIVASAGVGHAADLFTNPGASLKDPITGAKVNLSGLYISLGAGGVFSDADTTGTHTTTGNYPTTIFGGGDAALSGFLGDARIGIDKDLGGFSLGIYGDLSEEVAKGTSPNVPAVNITGSSATAHFGYGAGAKLGIPLSQTTVAYGLLGYQGQHISVKSNAGGTVSGSASTDLNGVLVGGGFENMISKNWGIAVEADYVAYGGWSPISGINVDADEIRTTARISYHFTN